MAGSSRDVSVLWRSVCMCLVVVEAGLATWHQVSGFVKRTLAKTYICIVFELPLFFRRLIFFAGMDFWWVWTSLVSVKMVPWLLLQCWWSAFGMYQRSLVENMLISFSWHYKWLTTLAHVWCSYDVPAAIVHCSPCWMLVKVAWSQLTSRPMCFHNVYWF